MATFEATNLYPREVTVKFPHPRDKGKYQTQKFDVWFETVESEELDAMIAEKRSVGELLSKVLKRVVGVQDKDGNELDEAAAIELCKANKIVATAIRDEFWKSVQGSVKS